MPSSGKSEARADVADWVAEHPALVRVNAVDSPWHDDNLAALADARGLFGVVLPKADVAAVRVSLATAGRSWSVRAGEGLGGLRA